MSTTEDFKDLVFASLVKRRSNQHVFNMLIENACQNFQCARPIQRDSRGFYNDGHIYIRELYSPAGKEVPLQNTYQQYFDKETEISIDPQLKSIKLMVISGQIEIIGEGKERKVYNVNSKESILVTGKERVKAKKDTQLIIVIKENNSRL